MGRQVLRNMQRILHEQKEGADPDTEELIQLPLLDLEENHHLTRLPSDSKGRGIFKRTRPFKYTLMFKIIKHMSAQNRSFLPFVPSFFWTLLYIFRLDTFTVSVFLQLYIFPLFSSWFGLWVDVWLQQLQPGVTETIWGWSEEAQRSHAHRAKRVQCKRAIPPRCTSPSHVPRTGGTSESRPDHESYMITCGCRGTQAMCPGSKPIFVGKFMTAIYGGTWDKRVVLPWNIHASTRTPQLEVVI